MSKHFWNIFFQENYWIQKNIIQIETICTIFYFKFCNISSSSAILNGLKNFVCKFCLRFSCVPLFSSLLLIFLQWVRNNYWNFRHLFHWNLRHYFVIVVRFQPTNLKTFRPKILNAESQTVSCPVDLKQKMFFFKLITSSEMSSTLNLLSS